MSDELRAEIKQGRPFGSVSQEAFLNLMRTSAILDHAFAEGIKPYGVTPTQYNVLRILRGAGRDGLCRNEVRDRMITQVPDATRLLDRLEDAGYVERKREGADRRFVTARITRAGLDLLDSMDEALAVLHERQLGHLTAPELRQLSRLLTKARRTG
ncbi:MAG TPA: MarR family transcriptional regulator [Gemmatimonadales bacterium]